MTGNKIDSIKIIHHELDARGYRTLADFFRLFGIFVCSATLEENMSKNDFDLFIISKEHFYEDEIAWLDSLYEGDLCKIESPSSTGQDNSEYERRLCIISQCLDYISNTPKYNMKDDVVQLRVIAKIFLKYDLIKERTFVYFPGNKDYAKKAKIKFLDALKEITAYKRKQHEKGLERSRYLDYACLYLPYLVNLTCHTLDQSFFFDNHELYRQIQKSATDFYGFPNYYILMAFIAELDKSMTRSGGKCYEMAIRRLEGYPFATYPYYRYGRYCEKVMKDDKKAYECYRRSFETTKKGYRSCYKFAIVAMKKNDYEEASAQFKLIISILKEKENANCLEEKEYEYLLKAYSALRYIAGIQRNTSRFRECEKLIEDLCNRTQEENAVYTMLYGENSDELKNRRIETYKRLRGNRLNNMVIHAVN